MQSFYFYDLETSGFNPREARIMQFAGQRTDMKLKPIGSPDNHLIKLTDDVLPEPDAVLVTGITPQKTIADGITEAEFLQIFHEQIATPGTIFVGYNTIRFDDEFMRFLHYRNYYDAYEWQWSDDRSKWDLLDVVRMTRALRPDGLKWPFDASGKPSNRLELLTAVNNIEHTSAHDALSDVNACIALAQLLQSKQPKLFNWLLANKEKAAITKLAKSGQPLVYSSGKYDSQYEKTTVVGLLGEHPGRSGNASLVFDLRYDPLPFTKLEPAELAAAWRRRKDDPGLRLPLKTMMHNRCPAIAPLSVLDADSQQRLSLDLDLIAKNFESLKSVRSQFMDSVLQALQIMDQKQQASLMADKSDVDAKLYDSFMPNQDRQLMASVRQAKPEELDEFTAKFKDSRLQALLPLYKARNYPSLLSEQERRDWEQFRQRKLLSGGNNSRAAKFFSRLASLAEQADLSQNQRYLLEELQLYGQSVLPVTD